MRTIKDYISEAQKKQGIPSNNKLAAAIGITNGGLSNLYKGKAIPTDETILKLAELAGIPEEEALIDVSIWRAADPKTKSIWERMRNMIISLCIALFVITFAHSAFAKNNLKTTCYSGINTIYTLCDNLQYKPRGFFGFENLQSAVNSFSYTDFATILFYMTVRYE